MRKCPICNGSGGFWVDSGWPGGEGAQVLVNCVACNGGEVPSATLQYIGNAEDKLRVAAINLYRRDTEVEQLKKEKMQLQAAMSEFCQRVDNGEVKSVRTYAKFKKLLETTFFEDGVRWPVYRTDSQMCKLFKTREAAEAFVRENPNDYFIGWDE